jgi:predicted butyrate kinase (DUF1464 family)
MSEPIRVIGIDPGTVSIDLCGLENGAVVFDRSIPTAEALADPRAFATLLEQMSPKLIAGPSGYGLPLAQVEEMTDDTLRLAYLAPTGESGGIGGLRTLARALAQANLPVLFTPGVVHLPSVPAHRKVNRVDMGTADKVCVAALAIAEQARRRGCELSEVSFILLELGGAFSACMGVRGGHIVDGLGGSVGPVGMCAAGALDGEVAFLAGQVSKSMLFRGGVTSILEGGDRSPERFGEPRTARDWLAWDAFMESAAKAVAALRVSVPHPYEIILSGRMVRVPSVARELRLRLSLHGPVRQLDGIARVSKEAAQGAALLADGLAGGAHGALVDIVGIREASGTVLDHLYVISPDAARRRLGLL